MPLVNITRRGFLRAAGVSLALPWLAALEPPDQKAVAAPRRLVCICTNLGLLERNFTPATAGRDYALTPYLEPFKDLRDHLTVISGTSHPGVGGGHSAEVSFLTAAPQPGTASFRNSISIDQVAAEQLGHLTRHASLSLVVAGSGNQSLSVSRSGVMLPADNSPAAVYRRLFIAGDERTVEQQIAKLRTGASILDTVGARATTLLKSLTGEDKERLDHYLGSVREVEKRLELAQEWERKPKPVVGDAAPADGEHLMARIAAMQTLMRLALMTDSTRLITLFLRLDGFTPHGLPGVSDECHNLSHHVGRQDKIDQLVKTERVLMEHHAAFLAALQGVREGGSTLLDRTAVLFGSNLGNGNNHDNRNLPILLAGGGFRHGQHLAFDQQDNTPLPNLFVSLLQRLGIATERFASSTGTLAGLALA